MIISHYSVEFNKMSYNELVKKNDQIGIYCCYYIAAKIACPGVPQVAILLII